MRIDLTPLRYFWLILGLFVGGTVLVLNLLVSFAFGATAFEWDRNSETDLDHYEMMACLTGPTCNPTDAPLSQIGTNIPQPAIGTKPTMPIPAGMKGRAAVVAVDQAGNRSGLSNVVPFDSEIPAAPTGLGTK